MTMSTPVNQLQNNPSFGNVAAAKLEEDMLVKGVIDEMESEVTQAPRAIKSEKPYEVHSTNVATFRHHSGEPSPQSQQQYNVRYTVDGPGSSSSSTSTLWNADDAQFAAIVAMIAFAVLYPVDASQVYNRFEFLSKLEPYDLYIRALVFGFILYIIVRKGLINIPSRSRSQSLSK